MNDKDLKKELEQYVKQNGLKYRFIAKQTNINESLLSNWRYDRRNLTEYQLERLKKIIRG